LGNYAVQIIKSRLDSLVTGTAPGFSDSNDSYINLQQLGFSTDVTEGSETQGLLVLDSSALSAALDSDPDGVAAVFSAYLDGITTDNQMAFSSSLYTATPAIYDVEVDMDNEDPPGTPAPRGRFRLQDGDWGDWLDLAGASGAYTLTGTTGPERGISLNITYAEGSGTHSTELSLKNGILAELTDELEDLLSTSGPLFNLDKNYNDIIDNIEDRIEQEERRLEEFEERLTVRFSRLDSYITRMNQMSEVFTNMTSNRSTSSS
jgi:flagellar hook-associated protein 2